MDSHENTVYEFQGCFWHGCKKCYSDDTINTKNQIDMLTLRKRTLKKNGEIRAAGYNLIEMYECELKKDKDFRDFMKTYDREIVERLNPRDGFFGGRTNVTKLTYAFKEGEKGKYVDFVSLYPTVQFYKKYPVGHPTKILEPESYDKDWFGFVKCKMLPPKEFTILFFLLELNVVLLKSYYSLYAVHVLKLNNRHVIITIRRDLL